MSRLSLSLAGLLALAACQAAPPQTPASGTPSTAATATPPGTPGSLAPSAAVSVVPTVRPSVSRAPIDAAVREFVQGSLYDENGAQLDSATVEVTCDEDPSVNQVLTSPGSFSLKAPVGATVKLVVAKAGFTTRTQVHKVLAVSGGSDSDANQVDFGGNAKGMLYALSKYPDITSVTPANLQQNVQASPLIIKLNFSQPLSIDTRGRFERLLQLHFQVAPFTNQSQAVVSDQVVTVGFKYNEQQVSLAWDEAFKVATVTVPFPLVTQQGTAAALRLGFDANVAVADWPLGQNGKRLGQDIVSNATSGSGAASAQSQIAPILRDHFDASVPSTRPSPLTLWGLTHWTDVSFSLGSDNSPLTVTSAVGHQGDVGQNDVIQVVFNKNVRAFPESVLDKATSSTNSYRFALGASDTTDARRAYDEADPARSGQAPIDVKYNTARPNVVDLQLPRGVVSRFNRFKLFVSPGVRDVNGVAYGVTAADATKKLSANVLEGAIQ